MDSMPSADDMFDHFSTLNKLQVSLKKVLKKSKKLWKIQKKTRHLVNLIL